MTLSPLGAVLMPANRLGERHVLALPGASPEQRALDLVERSLDAAALLHPTLARGGLELQASDWWLPVRELRAIASRLTAAGLSLEAIRSSDPRTLVAGAVLGLDTHRGGSGDPPPPPATRPATLPATLPATGDDPFPPSLTLHRGTLRSGDHLQSEGSVLLLGDVNPGARITATGHVLVWGRLRGTAHAGSQGDRSARIVALQLRPLQLRIATAVARGPEGSPPAGLAEQASLVDGVICLEPAPPTWPLGG
ncbi:MULTISPECIES: septum site-determining protein MinC [Aphanothece]|uniref:septum site-determining protein MinC n=1 Tax=Aphanothece TaxID=1121 RepID=UPI00398541C3